MNINEFKQLSADESQLLIKAPALITVLIGASDGKIDAQETEWAEKVVGTVSTLAMKIYLAIITKLRKHSKLIWMLFFLKMLLVHKTE